MKPFLWTVLGLLTLPLSAPAQGDFFQEPTLVGPLPAESFPAERFPADTFLYFGLDGGALVRGIPQLDLARFFANPDFRDFLLPLFQRIGTDPDDPVGSLMKGLPVEPFLDGQAAIGLRGFRMRILQPDGTETRVEILPGHPIDARALFKIAGLLTAQRMDGGWNLQDLKIEMGFDAMLVVDPGPVTVQMVRSALNQPESLGPLVREIRQEGLSDRTVTHLLLDPRATEGILTDLYADLEGPRWIVTTSAETFQEMAAMDPADSLAASPDFSTLHRRLCPGNPVFFAFIDSAEQLALLRDFVPPILTDALDLSGATSYRGSGMGVSLCEGGVHESLGLLLDGEPQGIWKLLDGFPSGIPTVRHVPAGTAALMTFKLDPQILFDRVKEVMGTLLPGTENRVEPLLAASLQRSGLDLRGDLLEALGDEVSLVLFAPPVPVAPPDWVVLVKLKDEQRAQGLLDKLEPLLVEEGIGVRFHPLEIGDGIPAQRILIEGLPLLPPTLAIYHGWLVCASRPKLIPESVDQWGRDPDATLARGSDSFNRCLRGLVNGKGRCICMLAWLDLHQVVPLIFTAAVGMIPPEFADTAHAPGPDEIAPFFSGAAFAVRHDDRTVTFDTFSPFGVLVPSGIAALFLARMEAGPR